jgi:hypothetical protein
VPTLVLLGAGVPPHDDEAEHGREEGAHHHGLEHGQGVGGLRRQRSVHRDHRRIREDAGKTRRRCLVVGVERERRLRRADREGDQPEHAGRHEDAVAPPREPEQLGRASQPGGHGDGSR